MFADQQDLVGGVVVDIIPTTLTGEISQFNKELYLQEIVLM